MVEGIRSSIIIREGGIVGVGVLGVLLRDIYPSLGRKWGNCE